MLGHDRGGSAPQLPVLVHDAIAVELTRSGAVWPSARGPRWRIHNYRRVHRFGQFTSVRFTERLDKIGARPSIGTIADSYDALAETTNGLYKTECVFGPMPPQPMPGSTSTNSNSSAQLGVDGLVTSQRFGDCAGHHRLGRFARRRP